VAELDIDDVRAALDAAVRHGFRHVRLRSGKEEFSAELRGGRAGAGLQTRLDPQPAAKDPSDRDMAEVRSPVVGYFRERTHPLEPGLEVQAGQVIAEVVAVGLANDVVAPVDGVVESVTVRPGDAVEYGQLLAIVRPA
jgi:biotin carboxyl carrier protein